MRIAVVGIGGVGGYIGAKLCALKEAQPEKYEIVFIARGNHAEAIKAYGLRVVEDDREFTVHPSEICTAEEAKGTYDLVLLCVKSYDIPPTVAELHKNLRSDTVIIPFANGVNNAQTIAPLVDAKILNGCVYILSHIESPGVIRKEGNVFAAAFGNPEYFGESLHVGYLFKDAGLRAKASEDIDRDVWKKYLFISAFATLTSYYGMSIKEVCEAHYGTAQKCLEEIAAVAAAKGIDLTGEVEKALKTAASLPETSSTSMHLDFQHGHKTELESLTGYVVHEASALEIGVPHMNEMYDELKERSHG
jgi:2-dehydropantoate 2-reductase